MAKIALHLNGKVEEDYFVVVHTTRQNVSASLLRGELADGARRRYQDALPLTKCEAMARRGELFPTAPDAEEIELDESFWRNARVVMPADGPKTSVHLRVDPDVFDWFKRQGKGHLTRMNAVLRAYYEANRKKAS